MRLMLGTAAVAVLAAVVFAVVWQLDGDALAVDPQTGLVNGLDQFDHVAYWEVANRIERDAELQVKACMEGEGLPYEDQDPTVGPPREARDADDAEYAASYGFGITPFHILPVERPPAHPLAEEVAAEFVKDEDNYERAYGGRWFNPLDGGCREVGYRHFDDTVGATNERWAELETARASFLSDPAVPGYFADWRDCMAEFGHDYPSPWHARQDFIARVTAIEAAGPGPGAFVELAELEKQVAIDSTTCGVSPRLGLPPELAVAWAAHAAREL